MCIERDHRPASGPATSTIPVEEAIGMVLAHDVTEIRKDEFKGRAFKKGHVIQQDDVLRLQQIGKNHLYVLNLAPDEMHEDDAAFALAEALMGEGVAMQGGPKEGKITLIAEPRRPAQDRQGRPAPIQHAGRGALLHDPWQHGGEKRHGSSQAPRLSLLW